MGLFWPRMVQPLKEAEVDGQNYGEDTGTDYAAETPAENTPPAAPAEQPPADQPPADQPQDAPPPEKGGEGGTDYTQMGEEPPPEDGGGAAAPADPQEESEVDPIKQQEEEMLDLSPEELDIKHKELKSNYLAMFDMVQTISERINDASTSEEYIPVVDYIAKQLSQLQNMLTDYMNSVYKTKSYTENMINYNRFLAVLNAIDKILVEMNKNEQKS